MKLEQRFADLAADHDRGRSLRSLDLTYSGAIKNSTRNCLAVFQNDPHLQSAVRYNILTERIDIVKPLWWSKQTATLNDMDLNYLMFYLEDKYALTSEKEIQKAISIAADCNKYRPIRDYLNSLECIVDIRNNLGGSDGPSYVLCDWLRGRFDTLVSLVNEWAYSSGMSTALALCDASAYTIGTDIGNSPCAFGNIVTKDFPEYGIIIRLSTKLIVAQPGKLRNQAWTKEAFVADF